jgi:hypothetical protein
MSDRDLAEQELGIELMTTQIDKFRQEVRGLPFVALAAILVAVAAVAGIILGVAHLIH